MSDVGIWEIVLLDRVVCTVVGTGVGGFRAGAAGSVLWPSVFWFALSEFWRQYVFCVSAAPWLFAASTAPAVFGSGLVWGVVVVGVLCWSFCLGADRCFLVCEEAGMAVLLPAVVGCFCRIALSLVRGVLVFGCVFVVGTCFSPALCSFC